MNYLLLAFFGFIQYFRQILRNSILILNLHFQFSEQRINSIDFIIFYIWNFETIWTIGNENCIGRSCFRDRRQDILQPLRTTKMRPHSAQLRLYACQRVRARTLSPFKFNRQILKAIIKFQFYYWIGFTIYNTIQ